MAQVHKRLARLERIIMAAVEAGILPEDYNDADLDLALIAALVFISECKQGFAFDYNRLMNRSLHVLKENPIRLNEVTEDFLQAVK